MPLPNQIVASGFPSPAEDFSDRALDLNTLLIRSPAATFFFRVEGDVLPARGILDGAMLIVDRSVSVRPGHVMVGADEGTLGLREFNGTRGVSGNSGQEYVDENVPLESWGVVTHIIRSLL